MKEKLKILEDSQPWYAEGLRFKCTECGQCCTGAPGYTWVTEEEVIAISQYLKISIDEFSCKYLRIVGDKLSLLEHPINYDCVFLKDKKCSIYPVRPKQCRTFPWWQRNLKSKEDWENAAKFCEGINKDAPIVTLKTISEQLAIQDGI